MNFKDKLKQRLFIAVSYIALGIALILIALLTNTDNSFFFSFGIALLLLGIMRILQYKKITKDDSSIRQQELLESDERMRMIAERARSWCFSLTVMLSGIAVLILSLMGEHTLAQPFAWFVCGMVLLYWICFAFLSKKY